MSTARGRRIADLAAALFEELGEPSELEQARAVAAAELLALAEDARARALGATGDFERLEMVVRLQGAADRAMRRLRLKATTAPQGETLAEHLAKQTGEGTSAKNGKAGK